MKNLILSAAIGDIAGMPYEFSGRTKDYNSVNLLHPSNTYIRQWWRHEELDQYVNQSKGE